MNLQRYLIRRLLQFVPMILVVIILNFVLIQLAPGDVAYIMAGDEASPEYIAQVREKFGLDKPVLEQLVIYLGRVLQLDLGNSYRFSEPVIDVIGRHLGPTLLLMLTSMSVAVVLGVGIGTFMARRAGSLPDVLASVISVGTYSIPVFWLGLMAILLFAIQLRWLPASGMRSMLGPREGLPMILDVASHLILPALTLSAVWIGQYLRLARTSVLQVLGEDFIVTSRAVGFRPRTVLMRYALPNAMLPIVSVLGLQIGLSLGGAVLTETVFGWPGLGRMLYDAVLARDIPLIMGAYIVLSVTVAATSLLTDLLYASLDPRVEYR